jgi:hypothetical protein
MTLRSESTSALESRLDKFQSRVKRDAPLVPSLT